MKILHTADWHIGQFFHEYDRTYEHQQFLNWLLGALISVYVYVLSVQRAIIFFQNFTKDEKSPQREEFTGTRIYFRISRQIFIHYYEQKRAAVNHHRQRQSIAQQHHEQTNEHTGKAQQWICTNLSKSHNVLYTTIPRVDVSRIK